MKTGIQFYKRLLIFIIFISGSFQMLACSCLWFDTYFCHHLNSDYHNLYLITITDSISDEQRKMHVLETLLFNQYPADTTVLQGANGSNCGDYLGIFDIGDTLLVALAPYQDSTLLLGGCGLSYLRYNQGNLIGKHSPGVSEIDYEFFKQNLGQCYTLSDLEDLKKEEPEVSLFPNPTSEQLTLEISNESISEITVYSLDGRIIHLEKNINQTRFSLDVQPFQKGIYFATIKVNDAIITRRFMVF